MYKIFQYYFRFIMYKLSLEGEDKDTSYAGSSPWHNGHKKQYFDLNELPEGYPEITNIKLNQKQRKLKERELESLALLKASADDERNRIKASFKKKKKAGKLISSQRSNNALDELSQDETINART